MKYKNLIVFLIGLLLIISGLLVGGIKELSSVLSRFVDGDVVLFEQGYHGFTSRYDINELKELDFSVNNANLTIYNDDIEDILLKVENAPNSIKFKEEQNVLKLSTHSLLNLNNKTMDISIYVPLNFVFDDISLEVNGGTVQLNQVYSKNLDIELNAGVVRGKDCYIDEYDIECNAGKVELISHDSLEQYGYDIDCNLGKVDIGNIHHSGIVEFVSEYKNKMIRIDCNAGKVEIKGD